MSGATDHPTGDRSRAHRVLGAVVALLLGVLALRPVTTNDVWWHLSMGREVLEAGSARFPEPLALSARGEYVDFVWLADVAMFLVHRLGGLEALNLTVALLAATSFLLCLRLARDVLGPGAPWSALLVATLAAGGAHGRFVPRPQAIFLVLLPLAILVSRRASRKGGTPWRELLALVAIALLWAQVHGSVVIAPAVVGAASLPWSIGRGGWSSGAPAGPGSGRRLLGLGAAHWAVLAVVGVAPLLGSAGLGLFDQIVAHRDGFAVAHNDEMQALRLEWWLAPSLDILCAQVLLAIGLVGAWRRRRIDVGPLLLALLGLWLALDAVRFASAWCLLLLPFAAEALRRDREEGVPAALGAGLAITGVLAVLGISGQAPSFAVDPRFPEAAVEAVRAARIERPLFVTYGDGGYLGWFFRGRPRVLTDSRSVVYFDDEEVYAATQALRDPEIFRRLDRLHGFGGALVPRDEALCPALAADPGWDGVWLGAGRTLFLPSSTDRRASASRAATPATPPAIRHLPLCAEPEEVLRSCRAAETGPGMLEEAFALLAVTPGDPELGRLVALLSLQCARPPELERAAVGLGSAELEPSHPDLPWIRGTALLAAGKPERALGALAQLPNDHARGQALRLHVLRSLDRPAEALPVARRQVELLDTRAPAELREHLAWACDALGERNCAVREALRAALSGHPAALVRLAEYRSRGRIPDRWAALAEAALEGSGLPAAGGSSAAAVGTASREAAGPE